MVSMPLHFHQAVQSMDIWSASSADVSFVISFASPNGEGLRGRHGFLASWRPLYSGTGAVKVTGSPFSTFEEAEAACNAMLKVLSEVRKPGDRPQSEKSRTHSIRHPRISVSGKSGLTSAPLLSQPEQTNCGSRSGNRAA